MRQGYDRAQLYLQMLQVLYQPRFGGIRVAIEYTNTLCCCYANYIYIYIYKYSSWLVITM